MAQAHDEKQAFAARLKQALKRSSRRVDSPTELATQFNLRYQGGSISNQAAQKWLSGSTLPTLEKIEILATWLNVSVQWLRYGIPEARPALPVRGQRAARPAEPTEPSESELRLLQKLRSLPEHQRDLVQEIVEQFALEQEMWRDE